MHLKNFNCFVAIFLKKLLNIPVNTSFGFMLSLSEFEILCIVTDRQLSSGEQASP